MDDSDEFIIIDDKPGTQAFASSINQVYGYCLAFKDTIKPFKNIIGAKRGITAALRQRGTDNFWSAYFDNKAESVIINLH